MVFMKIPATTPFAQSAAVSPRPTATRIHRPCEEQPSRAAVGALHAAALRPFVIAVLILISRAAPLWAAEPAAPMTNAVPARVAFTNLVAGLPVHDRVWLMGEQMKQLVGDWVNQQGDVGLDLLYFLQEPTKLLSDEVKRIELDHQKEIADLRAEIQALKQSLGMPLTNLTTAPRPAAPASSTNQAQPRPPPGSAGN